jgi:hypothetical protein
MLQGRLPSTDRFAGVVRSADAMCRRQESCGGAFADQPPLALAKCSLFWWLLSCR